jgi:hypothetical protein
MSNERFWPRVPLSSPTSQPYLGMFCRQSWHQCVQTRSLSATRPTSDHLQFHAEQSTKGIDMPINKRFPALCQLYRPLFFNAWAMPVSAFQSVKIKSIDLQSLLGVIFGTKCLAIRKCATSWLLSGGWPLIRSNFARKMNLILVLFSWANWRD